MAAGLIGRRSEMTGKLLADMAWNADDLRRFMPALDLLETANAAAATAGQDSWQFAVELHFFLAAGVAPADLRLCLAAGLAKHAIERPTRNGVRTFHPLANLSIPPRSCFVLGDAGARLGDRRSAPRVISPSPEGVEGPGMPSWDVTRRELRHRGRLVKRFRWKAANQELILSSFQELQWAPRIDDPLPPVRGVSRPTRLRETLRSLNRHQSAPRIQFAADGTGRGILWHAAAGGLP
jgi:hypothetical protein